MQDTAMTAAQIIDLLDMTPHPEGGHYVETFRDPLTDGDGRARSTAIYFLLQAGNARPGTGSTRWRPGTGTRARRLPSGFPRMARTPAR